MKKSTPSIFNNNTNKMYEGATAPILKVVYNYSNLLACLNFIIGQPIRYIEQIPEVMYYMVYLNNSNDTNIAVKEINKFIKESTNIQITYLEYLEMKDRLYGSTYYYNECINIILNKSDYIV